MDRNEQNAYQFIALNLDLHERMWQQHRDGILGAEDWRGWERWFREDMVGADMFPAVWDWEHNYYKDAFVRYVDAVVATEVADRAATAAAGGRPYEPRAVEDYADPPATPGSCD